MDTINEAANVLLLNMKIFFHVSKIPILWWLTPLFTLTMVIRIGDYSVRVIRADQATAGPFIAYLLALPDRYLSWSWLVGQVGSGFKVYSGC